MIAATDTTIKVGHHVVHSSLSVSIDWATVLFWLVLVAVSLIVVLAVVFRGRSRPRLPEH